MATLTAQSTTTRPAWKPKTSTLEEIIAEGRAQPAKMRGALVLSLACGLLMWGAFTPLDFGALGWISLVPLLFLARLERPTRGMYKSAYVGGLLFWIAALQWMRLGHSAMYGGWIALSVYMAMYFPLALALTRTAVWRLRVPLTLAAPIVWTGLELLRGFFMTGFAWYFLAHSQHQFQNIIQISDLVGAYGVTFLMVAFSGCLADLMPAGFANRWGLVPAHAPHGVMEVSSQGRWWRLASCLAAFAACWGYGAIRTNTDPFEVGPRVALIQGNFECELQHDEDRWIEKQHTHERLTASAVPQQPDLIIWPEGMFRWPLLEASDEYTNDDLQQAHPRYPIRALRDPNIRKRLSYLAQIARAGLIVGLSGVEMDLQSVQYFNSAVFVHPSGEIDQRYDKMHRVVFGEYVPFANDFPWMKKLTPYPEDFGIQAGRGVVAYDTGRYRFSPVICFEDTVPHLVRSLVGATAVEAETGRKEIDFLVNISNDGWFRGSNEHRQHLIIASFRCIETRTPMVRAVNTGISAIIDGNGGVREQSEKATEDIVIGHIPLDSRESVYVKTGDWFAGTCLSACCLLAIVAVVGRKKNAPTTPVAPVTSGDRAT